MTVCKNCKGVGYIIAEDRYSSYHVERLECDGKGVVEPMTEQEWLQTATTEQLAEVLWEQINGAFNSGYACCNLKQDKDYVGRYKRFMEWLKQPHHEKE